MPGSDLVLPFLPLQLYPAPMARARSTEQDQLHLFTWAEELLGG